MEKNRQKRINDKIMIQLYQYSRKIKRKSTESVQCCYGGRL